ncbi:MAG: hypothetical protein V1859_10235 [archaeon]
MTDICDFAPYHFNRIIKYSGLLDFDDFYKFCQRWMKERNWDFYELKAKDKPPYQVYKWIARKKVNYYGMIQINIEITLWESKEVEAIVDGKKKKMIDTKMKFDLSGAQITDYDGDFEKNDFLKKVEKFLNNYVLYHENLLQYFDYLDYYLHDFFTEIKKYLKMETASNAY